MTQVFVPPKLMPWVTFGNDTVQLKPDAPESLRPEFEKLRDTMKKLNEEASTSYSMPISKDRLDRFTTKLGDTEILHHPDPQIEKQLKEMQEKDRKEQAENENKK